MLGAIDWREFAESNSIVERTLRQDPRGLYAAMDFATRDRYRHVVEALAKGSPVSEVAVADAAIKLARESAAISSGNPAAHVGFYLIDEGRPRLESAIQGRLTPLQNIWRAGRERPLLYYLSAIALITAGLAGALVFKAYADGAREWLLAAVGILTVIASSQVAVELVNWIAQMIVTPHPLPRMDFSDGIPSSLQTLVVVPTMLTNAADIEDLTEALEVHFLANRDRNLHFGLLTDFPDADTEVLPQDAALLDLTRRSIEDLNERYADASSGSAGDEASETGDSSRDGPFFLFHRPRQWNSQERVWMGFERKRGKLADLNALLRGKGNAFSLVVGNTALLPEMKYVISLDSDTQLPRDAARQFVGAMGLVAGGVEAHVLDRPGGIFVRRAEQIAAEDRILMQSVARVIISDSKGSFADQITRRAPPEPPLSRTGSALPRRSDSARSVEAPPRPLLFDNGLGGFAVDGREYVITTGQARSTPLPWSNVIANAQFGTVITESGQAYTWGENAHVFQFLKTENNRVEPGRCFDLKDRKVRRFGDSEQPDRSRFST